MAGRRNPFDRIGGIRIERPRNNHPGPAADQRPKPGLGALIDAMACNANRVFSMNCALLCKSSSERDQADLPTVVQFTAMGRAAEGVIAVFQRICIK